MAKAERAAAKAAAGRETSHTDSQNVVHQKEATQEPQGVPKNAKATTAAGGRPIVRLDDSLTVLETYQSVAEASRSIGISAKSLRDAARGVQKHAGGYVWRYADELES
jgi:DNA polymerase-3 subunit epsilon